MALRKKTDYTSFVGDRFLIAQDGPAPDREQLELQRVLADAITHLAEHLDATVADNRPKAIALTHLEDALMWIGKAIFQPDGIR